MSHALPALLLGVSSILGLVLVPLGLPGLWVMVAGVGEDRPRRRDRRPRTVRRTARLTPRMTRAGQLPPAARPLRGLSATAHRLQPAAGNPLQRSGIGAPHALRRTRSAFCPPTP